MKRKNKPKIVVLTNYDIAIAEFKSMRQFNNWLQAIGNSPKKHDIRRVLTGKAIRKSVYLPL